MKAVLLTLLLIGAAGPAMAQSAVSYFPAALAQPVKCAPPSALGSMPVVSPFENTWFSQQLSAAKEPSLSSPETTSEQGAGDRLRFTWLRSFHPPVIVRLEGVGTKAPHLIAKQLSGTGGYDPGSVDMSLDRALTAQEGQALTDALSAAKLTTLPPECSLGLDGASWLVELADSKGYHLIKRWSPKEGEVRTLGLFLLGLTGWKFDPIY
ncbi:MAG: hypothetical protein JWM33_944 [Caulobacteraceae bacterium]|nr:hypothetical protein [Caulobacteraceae bacterium]